GSTDAALASDSLARTRWDPAYAGPVIVAAAPHRHWLDSFVVCSALPGRLRRRLVAVTNYDFAARFAPTPADRWWTRLLVGLAYPVLVPLVFAFVVLTPHGRTRDGLLELGRLLDLGWSPLTFPKGLFFEGADAVRHDPGIALLALETQTPV